MKADDLRDEANFDIESIQQTLGPIDELVSQIGSDEPTIHQLAAFGAYLQSIYNGLENILKRFSNYHQVKIPEVANWHEALLRMFTEPPSQPLPAILTPELNEAVSEYRSFRHIFRKNYAMNLDWEKIQPLLVRVRPTLAKVVERIEHILKEL